MCGGGGREAIMNTKIKRRGLPSNWHTITNEDDTTTRVCILHGWREGTGWSNMVPEAANKIS